MTSTRGPTDLSVEYYGQRSHPAWPYYPCANGPFDARIDVQRSAYDLGLEASYEWSMSYSVTIDKVDSGPWTPFDSNVVIPQGPIACDGAFVSYWIVSGLQRASVLVAVGDPGHGSVPVMLLNSATHLVFAHTVRDRRDEKFVEAAGFYVPNDASLIGLSIYHQGFVYYYSTVDGFAGLLSTRGAKVKLLP